MYYKFIVLTILCLLAGCTSSTRQFNQARTNFNLGDYHIAFNQLEPLAKKGNPDAQYALGYMYYYGYGTSMNYAKAQYWINLAANQGSVSAVQALKNINFSQNNLTTTNPLFINN